MRSSVKQSVTLRTRLLGVFGLLLLTMPGGFGQVRRMADRKASGRLDDLARQLKNRIDGSLAPSLAPREVYEPERAVRKRNSAARVVLPKEPEPSPAGVATVTPAFGGFQALVDNFKVIPPDTEGAVGPQHVVTMLNSQVLIQSRTGAVRDNFPITLNNFWSPLDPTFTDTFDPRILYDAAADRWIACASVNGNNPQTALQAALLLAVSQTGDPGGAWNYFQTNFNAANTSTRQAVWGDYPELGFNANWVVVSVNIFGSSSGNYQNTNLYVFQKSDLYQKNGTGAHVAFSDGQGELTPVLDFDNQPDTLYLLQAFATGFGPAGSAAIRISKLQGPVGSETFTGGNGGLIRINDPWSDSGSGDADFGPQLGSTVKIDTGDSRLLNCMMRGGSIWCAHTIFLPYGAPARASAQWFQIDPVSSPPQVVQRGRIDDPTSTYFYAYPTIAVNKNNDALIGYTRLSANDYASAEFSFRTGTDPPNTMQPDVMFKQGEAPYVAVGSSSNNNRWGDYSATLVDPANDLGFWTLQEYAATPPQGRSREFATWWAQVLAPSSGLNCTYLLSQSVLSFTNDGGSGTLSVSTGAGCPWLAASNVPWVAVTGGTPGSGSGTVQYTVAKTANATDFRNGTVTVGGLTIGVQQGTAGGAQVPAFTAQAVVNAASYQGGSVVPGELIAIFGGNLGPPALQQPTVSASGVVATIAGGTRVWFDGAAAPMIYASAGQVSAVVPFGVQGRASTQVQVEYLGVLSAPIAIPVSSVLPGIFTLNASGKGAAIAATAGSTIVIYATGGGAMTPAVADGTTAHPTLSTLNPIPTARIGGVPATVAYAGVAPGIIAGVLQINITVPPGVSRGIALPVDVTVGGVTSQSGVTVTVQ